MNDLLLVIDMNKIMKIISFFLGQSSNQPFKVWSTKDQSEKFDAVFATYYSLFSIR